MTVFINQHFGSLSTLQSVLWIMYLVAAVMLPAYHLRPILKYSRGKSGIGDACIRTEAIQCAWRVPALFFSILVVPSLPLFLSIFLDMVGRIGRILAMHTSQRRWHASRAAASGQAVRIAVPNLSYACRAASVARASVRAFSPSCPSVHVKRS